MDSTDDDSHIDLRDPGVRADWARRMGLTDEAVETAVQAVGDDKKRVMDYLAAGGAGDQEDG